MLSSEDAEDKISSNDQKIKELEIRMETLDQHASELWDELAVTPTQIRKFLENPEHFTEENWAEVQKMQQEHEAKLKLLLDNIRNPSLVKKRQAERNVGQHWLFVR